MKEIENIVEKPIQITEKKTVKFQWDNEKHEKAKSKDTISSEESQEDEEDYLEIQREKIKSGSDAAFSEIKSKKKQKKHVKTRKENSFFGVKDEELPMIDKLMKEKMKMREKSEKNEKNEKNLDMELIAGENFKKQLLLEEIERKKKAEKEKDLEEMKRIQEKFKNEMEENKRKKKEKKQREIEEKAIFLAEQK